LWRFTTSTTQKSYVPPLHGSFEVQMVIPRSEEQLEEKKRYVTSTFGSELFGMYKSDSPYKTKSAYKTRSEYK
jgi:hypothetical protein